jgi:hypothetical protein
MAGRVYESIWDVAAAHVRVTLPGENGEWVDPDLGGARGAGPGRPLLTVRLSPGRRTG